MTVRILTLALFCVALAFGGATVTFTGPDQVSRAYTLKDHPRIMFDGPTGTISLRLKDPDGSGPLKNANYDTIVGQAMVSRVTSSRSGCLVGGVIKNCRATFTMSSEAAMLWWMCNQCTTPWGGTYLDFAKDVYLHMYDYGFKRWFGSHKFGDATAADNGENPTGMADYLGPTGWQAMVGYSIIRDQLTSGERSTIANYFLNGMVPGEYCEYPTQRQSVRVRKLSGGTLEILDGASWPAGTDVGDTVQVNAYKDASDVVITSNQGPGGRWMWVGNVTAKTATTLTLPIGGTGGEWMPNFNEGYLFTYRSSFASNTCSTIGVPLMHSQAPYYVEPGYTENSRELAADVPAIDWSTALSQTSGVTSTIPIANCATWAPSGYPTPTPSTPWKAAIRSDWEAEVILIEGQSGCNLTVRRGLYSHGWAHPRCPPWSSPPCYGYGPNKITLFQHKPVGARQRNTGLSNLELTRTQSVLAVALAFADDDPRAQTLLQIAGNYFSTESYYVAKKFYGMFNYSIGGYGYGRGAYYHRMALLMTNAVSSPTASWIDGNHLKHQGNIYPFWHLPWSPTEPVDMGLEAFESCMWRLSTSSTEANSSAYRDCSQIAFLLQLSHPTADETKYAWAWLTGNEISHKFHTTATMWATGEYMGEGVTLWHALWAGYPTAIQTAADKTAMSTSYVSAKGDSQSNGGLGYKIGVSRSDWTTSATYAWMLNYDSFSDKIPSGDHLHGYAVGKNGWFVYSPEIPAYDKNRFGANRAMSGMYFDDVSKSTFFTPCTPTSGHPLTDGLCPQVSFPSYGTSRSSFVHLASEMSALTKGGYGATYANFHNVNWNWDHFWHVKGGTGTKDYVVKMYEFNRSEPTPKKARVYTLYNQDGQASVRSEANVTYAEGNTAIASDFSHIESRTAGTFGAVSKNTSRWLVTGGTAQAAVYDLRLKRLAPTGSLSPIEICSGASVQYPCRVKVDGVGEWSYTAPVGTVTIDLATASANNYKLTWITFDPSTATFRVKHQSGIVTVPTCTGAVSCDGVGTPGASELLLMRHRYSESGSALDDCLRSQSITNQDSAGVHHGPCIDIYDFYTGGNAGLMDSVKPLTIETTPSNSGVVWMWHRPTLDLAETAGTGTELVVTGGNHKALQINDATEPIVLIAPIGNARATDVSVPATFSGSQGRIVACGMAEGTYSVRRNGVDVATGISVGESETCVFASGLTAGSPATLLVTRTAGITGNLQVSPAAVVANYVIGGSAPANQTIAVSGVGVTLGTWTAAVQGTVPWLTLTSGGTTGNGTTQAAFNVTGLSTGTYQGTIRFTASQGDITNSPIDVIVTLTVSAPGSISLSLSPTTLNFNTTQGAGNPPNQTITFTSPGGTLDNFTVSDNQTWCSVSPSSGSTATTLTVSIDNTTLTSSGSPRTCTITVSSTTSGVTNSPQQASAIVTTAASASVTLSLGGPLSFSAVIGQGNPPNQPLPFSASGIADNYSTTVTYQHGSGWLFISPGAGDTVATLTASVDTTSLTVAGTYCATVTASSTDPDVVNSPTATVCVTMTDPTPAPHITEPGSYLLTLGQASGFPFGIETGTGTAPFTWSLSGSVPGLSLTSASGTSTTLAGTPTALGDYQFQVNVIDGAGVSASILRTATIRPSPGQADFTVDVTPVEGGATVVIKLSNLNANDVGRIVVRDGAGVNIKQDEIPQGTAVRSLLLRNLSSAPPYSLEFSYPSGSVSSPAIVGATKLFTPLVVTGQTGTLSWRGTPPAGEGIDNVVVYYGTDQAAVEAGTSASMTDATCTSAAECNASASVARGGYYVLAEYKNGSTVVRRDPVVSVIPVLR